MSNSRIEARRRCLRRLAAGIPLALGVLAGHASAAVVAPDVLAAATRDGFADALLILPAQSQLAIAPLASAADFRVKRRALVAALQARAAHDQNALLAWLDASGIVHRDFWIVNAIEARVPAVALDELAARVDVARVEANPSIALHLPPQPAPAAPTAVEASGIAWGVAKVDAPLVWAEGIIGQGVVIGGEDTGYQWDHPALKAHYRGWNGEDADHDFNWHDAIHDSSGNTCGNDSPFPCDDSGHGTHTAGTFVGNDGAGNATGVAPGAKWIGCRNMNGGVGTPARYIECMQWLLAPTDLSGANANPDLAPDIVNNSWACPPSEGCTVGDELAAAVQVLVDAGIFYVAAAQNTGPGCGTIADAPATYDASFDAGATDSNDTLIGFSSRGPVSTSSLIRPDLVAPGASVYSSVPVDDYGYKSGTSMSSPHVAGVAALLISAFPPLRGHPARIAAILRATAVTSVANTSGISQTCGDTSITQWPNDMAGYGRVDAWNAFREIVFTDDFDH